MKRRGLMIGIFVLAAVGTGLAIFFLWPSREPEQKVESWVTSNVDHSKPASISWVNDSGKPCKLTVGGTGEGLTVLNVTVQLPEGPQPQGLILMNAPFMVKNVTLERDGKKVETDLNLTVPAGGFYEIHVGPDDQIKAIDKTPAQKPAP